jgi:hypothetical protein
MVQEMDINKVNAVVKIMLSIRRHTKKLKKLEADFLRIGRTLTQEEQNEYLKRMA